MTNKIIREARCPSCGFINRINRYETIDIRRSRTLKEKIFDRSIFINVCRGCGRKFERYYFFNYVDTKNMAVVTQGPIGKLLRDKEELEKRYEGYKIYASSTLIDTLDLIRIVDYRLDPRYAQMYVYLKVLEMSSEYDESLGDYCEIRYSHLIVRDDELCVEIVYAMNGNQRSKVYTFDFNEYKRVCEEFSPCEYYDAYYFDYLTAKKVFTHSCDEEYFKRRTGARLVCIVVDGGREIICRCNKEYTVGDSIEGIVNGKAIKGVVVYSYVGYSELMPFEVDNISELK